MGQETGISWCDATFNPWLGCSKITPGCANCYALDVARGRMGIDVWDDSPRRLTAESTWANPRRWARTMPKKLGRRPRVFCASMADVFEELDYLEEWRLRLFDLIAETPELDWLLLTKRIEFAAEWLDFRYHATGDGEPLPNVWLGTSIENQRFTSRADVLRDAPAAVRFISAEPLLGSLLAERRSPVAERLGPDGSAPRSARKPLELDGIDWLIVGGESGSKARPIEPEWVRELRDYAVAAGVAFHFKQWGGRTAKAGGKDLDGREWCEFPKPQTRELTLA